MTAVLTAVSEATGRRGAGVRLTEYANSLRPTEGVGEGKTAIPHGLVDAGISFRGIGIASLLYAYPAGHVLSVVDLVGASREGRDAVFTVLVELSGSGWVEMHSTYRKVRIPGDLRMSVLRRDGFRCVECDAPDDLMADHVIPESAGGPTTFENLQTLCRHCNSQKGATRCRCPVGHPPEPGRLSVREVVEAEDLLLRRQHRHGLAGSPAERLRAERVDDHGRSRGGSPGHRSRSPGSRPGQAMLILVTGGRDWTDRTLIAETLLDAQRSTEDQPGRRMALMSGACPQRRVGDSWGSADWHAEQVADGWGWLVLRRPAEWESGGKGAGFARNQAMVRECAEHLAEGVVVACRAFLLSCTDGRCRRTDDHWSHGTNHCAHRAHEAGIPVAGVDRTGARWMVAGEGAAARWELDRSDWGVARSVDAGAAGGGR